MPTMRAGSRYPIATRLVSTLAGRRQFPTGAAISERDHKFESGFLQRRVTCEPVSGGNPPYYVEKPRFSAGVRAGASGAVGRDVQGAATSGLRGGNCSVGVYSSTAPPVMWAA